MSPLPEPFASVYVFVIGLVLGSFLNVCIHRLPVGQSVVHPRSRCPRCKQPILWYQNVPVLSWLFLGGRCAGCRAPISWRYPAIELACGGVVLGSWLAFGWSPTFGIVAYFGLAMLALFFTDYDHQLLPDAITLSGVMLGVAAAWWNPFLDGVGIERVWHSLWGAAIGAGPLWLFGFLYSKWRGVEALGMGDVKLMAMVGAFAGPAGVLLTLFGGSIAGAVLSLLLMSVRGWNMQTAVPFGCFLTPAAVGALLFGRRVIEAYLDLVVPLP